MAAHEAIIMARFWDTALGCVIGVIGGGGDVFNIRAPQTTELGATFDVALTYPPLTCSNSVDTMPWFGRQHPHETARVVVRWVVGR